MGVAVFAGMIGVTRVRPVPHARVLRDLAPADRQPGAAPARPGRARHDLRRVAEPCLKILELRCMVNSLRPARALRRSPRCCWRALVVAGCASTLDRDADAAPPAPASFRRSTAAGPRSAAGRGAAARRVVEGLRRRAARRISHRAVPIATTPASSSRRRASPKRARWCARPMPSGGFRSSASARRQFAADARASGHRAGTAGQARLLKRRRRASPTEA
mgnify:CR=1 FL=1